jgi:hypothetical protein
MYMQRHGSAQYGIEGFSGTAQSRAMPLIGGAYVVSFCWAQ